MGQRVRGYTATNDITGAVIKTKPPTSLYATNHDKIFAKKPATEWITLEEHQDRSLDDFLEDIDVVTTTPIKYKEFKERMGIE